MSYFSHLSDLLKEKFTREYVQEMLSSFCLIFIGVLCAGRGIIWIITGDEVLTSHVLYQLIAKYMPIQAWGLLYLGGGLCTIVSGLIRGRVAYGFLVIGAIQLIPCNLILYAASTVKGINLYTPFSTGWLLLANIFLMMVGGLLLWISGRE